MSSQPYFNANASGPPVVQGMLVTNNNNYNNQATTAHTYDHRHPNHGVGALEGGELPPHQNIYEDADNGGTWTKGEVQPKRCNDAFFAVLFYAHLIGMAVLASTFAPQMLNQVAEQAQNADGQRNLLDGEESQAEVTNKFSTTLVHITTYLSSSTIHRRSLEENDSVSGVTEMSDLLLLLSISALIALPISTLALSVMIRHAQKLIKFALFFNITVAAVFAIGSLFVSPFAALSGILLLAFTAYYAYVVWGRIPFAACNLVTATTAVKANLGLAFFAYGNLFIMVGWSSWWLVTFTSTVYVLSECDSSGNCAKETNGFIVFLLMLSYYWTYQVVKNVLHVTVAGTVGTWWFVPTDAATFCSSAVRQSYVRSVTTSFGSICFGSLLVAILEALKSMVRNLRESEDGGGILLCLAECLLAFLADIMEYFNQWAFVFVGLYGYDFLTAGKNVLNLFNSRGWTTIITDSLAQGVLGMVAVAVGLITGTVALAIARGKGMVFGDELGASAASFFLGFTIGWGLTNTLMTLVSSAVNTVIVCYAEAPAEFQTNYPKLSADMRASWREAWPTEFRY